MGKEYKLSCKNCGQSYSFGLGWFHGDKKYIYPDIMELLEKGAYGTDAVDFCRYYGSGKIELSRKLYSCKKCGNISERYKVRLISDEMSFSSLAFCEKCGGLMTQTKESKIGELSCPHCREKLSLDSTENKDRFPHAQKEIIPDGDLPCTDGGHILVYDLEEDGKTMVGKFLLGFDIIICNERNEKGSFITEANSNGESLTISGYDSGALAEEFFGKEEYEYHYTFDRDNTTVLTNIARREHLSLSYWLLVHFSGIDGAAELIRYCERNGIEYSFASV